MSFSIEYITEQGGTKMNEDALIIGKRRFAVFDGASSLDGYVDDEGKTGGYHAAQIAQQAFNDELLSLAGAAQHANEAIHAAMQTAGIDTSRKESVWCTTLAAVDLDVEKREFAWEQIADALILVIYNDGSHKMVIQDDYDHDREVLMKWKQLANAGNTNIIALIQNELLALRKTQNINYGVLNGEPAALERLRSGKESLEHVKTILLFTDGLMLPKEDPAVPDDFRKMTEIFRNKGLAGLKEHVREVEESDPECIKYPRYKKHDDIATIAITFA